MPAADTLAVFSAPSQTHAPSMGGHPGNSFGRAVVSGGDAPGACGSASGAAKPRRCRAPAATFGRQPRATSVAGAAFVGGGASIHKCLTGCLGYGTLM